MEMNNSIDGDLLVMDISGDITFFNVGQVISEIDQARAGYQIVRVVINAGRVSLVDSAALGALVSKSRQLLEIGGYMRLINPHTGIVNALHRIHTEEILPSFSTLDEALGHA